MPNWYRDLTNNQNLAVHGITWHTNQLSRMDLELEPKISMLFINLNHLVIIFVPYILLLHQGMSQVAPKSVQKSLHLKIFRGNCRKHVNCQYTQFHRTNVHISQTKVKMVPKSTRKSCLNIMNAETTWSWTVLQAIHGLLPIYYSTIERILHLYRLEIRNTKHKDRVLIWPINIAHEFQKPAAGSPTTYFSPK